MASAAEEHDFLRVLRWMADNVAVVSGIYCWKIGDGSLVFDPFLRVKELVVTRAPGEIPRAMIEGDNRVLQPKLNSAAALIVCCYMEALGKVLKEGDGSNIARFDRFVRRYLDGWNKETGYNNPPFKSADRATRALYTQFRCGFAHQFANGGVGWNRGGRTAAYFTVDAHGRPGLNVDRLAAEFLAGLQRFKDECSASVERGETTFDQLLADLDAQEPA